MTSRAAARHPYHHGDLRRALVAEGVELARAGGPSAIVLREAARRVGVSPNAAYRHFRALPELIDAVADEALAALARSMEAELARCGPTGDPGTDALSGLGAVGRGYVHFALGEPGLFATAFSRHETEPADQDERRGVGDSGLGPDELLARALDGMVDAGLLDVADRDAAATKAWADVHGLSELLLGPLAGQPPTEREALIDACLDLTCRGLLTRRAL